MHTLRRRWAPYVALLLVGAFVNLIAPPIIRAQTSSVDDTLHQAQTSFLEGDYEGAVDMLEPLLTQQGLNKEQIAKTHELLAYCYDALDKEDKIRENVRFLFEMNRKYPMKSEWMADRMKRIVDEVKTELAKEDSTKTAQPVVTQKTATPPDHMTAKESEGKSNTKKYLLFGGAAVVGIGLVALLAGGGGGSNGPDTLPSAPGTPAKK